VIGNANWRLAIEGWQLTRKETTFKRWIFASQQPILNGQSPIGEFG
jgi:hypothetical protein